MKTELSRRSFFGVAAAAGLATAGAGLAGCAPSGPEGTSSGTGGENHVDAADWLGAPPDINSEDIVNTLETDLLIIGAGNAGVVAAATAADLELDFMLCEKTGAVQETRYWIGAVNTKQHKEAGITVDEGRLLNELSRYASNKCNQNVWKTWIRESAEAIEWLDGILGEPAKLDTQGYELETGEANYGTGYYVPAIQHMYGELPFIGTTDRDALLEEYVTGKGYEIHFNHDMQVLIRDDNGKVTGAVFSTNDGLIQINANNTLLATGGYPANRQMIREISPILTKCITADGFMPNCDGYGIRAAMWIDAAKDVESAPMVFDRGIALPGTDAGYDSDTDDARFNSTYGGIGQFVLGSQPFMKVSRNGVRFANESTPYDFMPFAASEQPGGVYASIFDANAQEDLMRFSTIGCSKLGALTIVSGAPIDEVCADELERGFLIKADTIEELADGLGFSNESKTAFLEQVERYNEYFDNQKDEEYGKEAYRLSTIRQAPYYGFWLGGTLLTTLDGLKINENMQVLDNNAQVIDGLYAAGDCSGSLFSGNYPELLVGCACGRTITFGRHAVRYIAGAL